MEKKLSANGKFRRPKGYFSQISNEVLCDPSLSLRAKGLYSLIVAHITRPGFTLYKGHLQSLCSEGRCAFDSAWKELKDAGYLRHIRVQKENGTFYYEYELLFPDAGSEDDVEKFYIDAATPSTEPVTANTPEQDVTFFREPVAEKQAPASIYNNNKNNKILSVVDNEKIKSKIKKQIDYHYFCAEPCYQGAPVAVVGILVDYLCEIEQESKQLPSYKKQQVGTVDSCTIVDFLEHIKGKHPGNIRNPNAYWKKAFYNYLRESSFDLVAI